MTLAPFFRSSLLLAVLTLAVPALAAKPRAVSTLDPSSIELGETARLEVQVIGTEAVGDPPPLHVEGLEVRSLRSGLKQSIEVVNGRFTQNTIVIYSYELTPKRLGTFNIPALDIAANGELVHTQPVALKVEKAGGQTEGLDPQGHGEIYLPKNTVWVGEQLPVQMRLRVDSRIDWNFSALPSLEADGFTHAKTSQPRRDVVERDGRTWDLGSFQTYLTPTRAGKLQIGPGVFEWRAQVPRAQRARPSAPFSDIFPEDLFRDLRNGFGVIQPMRTSVDPVEITVKPLPPGEPKSFSGAVGKFWLTSEGSPAKVKIGDPITVKVTVAGRGNFDRVSAPGLADSKGWRTYPATEKTVEAEDDAAPPDRKTFEVAVIPEAKQTQMPVFEFSYFDPETAKYVTLHTANAPLTVEGEPAPPLPPPAPAAALPAPGASAAPGPAEILGLRYDLGAPVSPMPLYREKGFLELQLIPLGILGLWTFGRLWRPNLHGRRQAGWRRRRAALAAQLRRERDRQAFYETAAQVLQLDAALRTGQPPETIDAATACRGAKEGVPVEEIFEERAAALFAGGGSGQPELTGPERERILRALA